MLPARLRRRLRPRPDALPRPRSTDVALTFPWCLQQGIVTRPQYLWGVLLAVRVAKALGAPRIAVIEFGVAGGNGLLALEAAGDAAGELCGVAVEVFGFDTGRGMPEPDDPRDAPWLIKPGWFELDEPALRARLSRAELVLGPVEETVPAWMASPHPPVGFIAFDLDTYTATRDALALLRAAPEGLLPRVPCYFDDLFGYGWTDFTGERAAIDEFNAGPPERRLGFIHGLRHGLPPSQHPLAWHEQMYLLHAFDHPQYRTYEGDLAEGWLAAHRLAPPR